MRIPDAPARLSKTLRYSSGRGSPNDPTGRIARAYYLERLRGMARDRKGTLLSRTYVNDTTKLRFRCAEGHAFLAAPTHVNQGKWCARCGRARTAALRKAPAIARLHEIVRRHGGVLLTPMYLNSQTKLRFQCAHGHRWEAIPASILKGTWCRTCSLADPKRHEAARVSVARRLQRVLKARGCTMLSDFVGLLVPIRIRCTRGHCWETTAAKLDEGTWCRSSGSS